MGTGRSAGNVSEWIQDWFVLGCTYEVDCDPGFVSPYTIIPCDDCADLTSTTLFRAIRGSGYFDDETLLISSRRGYGFPSARVGGIGVRCARGAQ